MNTELNFKQIHSECGWHETAVKESNICGCFYCMTTFPPSEIEEWIDEPEDCPRGPGRTAICPKCGIGCCTGQPVRYYHNNGRGPVKDGGDVWVGTVLTHRDDQPLPEKVEIEKKPDAVSWALGPKLTELDHKPFRSPLSGWSQNHGISISSILTAVFNAARLRLILAWHLY